MVRSRLISTPVLHLITRLTTTGQWVSGSYKQFEVTDPGNGKVIGAVDELGVKETKDAIESAQAAYKLWNNTT